MKHPHLDEWSWFNFGSRFARLHLPREDGFHDPLKPWNWYFSTVISLTKNPSSTKQTVPKHTKQITNLKPWEERLAITKWHSVSLRPHIPPIRQPFFPGNITNVTFSPRNPSLVQDHDISNAKRRDASPAAPMAWDVSPNKQWKMDGLSWDFLVKILSKL